GGALQNAELMAECKDLELKRRTAPEGSEKRGQKSGQYLPERESKEERQLPVYQSDRIFREPQFALNMVGPNPRAADIRFMDPPGSIRATQLTANPLIQKRCVALDPSPNCDVVDGEPALGHDLFQVPVRERVLQIPPDAQNDDYIFEMSS